MATVTQAFEPDWFREYFNERFPPDQDSYAPKEIYLELDCSRYHVYQAIRTGALDAFRLNERGLAVPRPALREWLLRNLVINSD